MRDLVAWARKNKRPLSIRLVKGAYNEPASIAYPKKQDVDASFLALAVELIERAALEESFKPRKAG